jgi:gas vesicle protein
MHKKKRTPTKGIKKEIIALRDSIEDLTEEVHSLKENRVNYVREPVLPGVPSKSEHTVNQIVGKSYGKHHGELMEELEDELEEIDMIEETKDKKVKKNQS